MISTDSLLCLEFVQNTSKTSTTGGMNETKHKELGAGERQKKKSILSLNILIPLQGSFKVALVPCTRSLALEEKYPEEKSRQT